MTIRSLYAATAVAALLCAAPAAFAGQVDIEIKVESSASASADNRYGQNADTIDENSDAWGQAVLKKFRLRGEAEGEAEGGYNARASTDSSDATDCGCDDNQESASMSSGGGGGGGGGGGSTTSASASGGFSASGSSSRNDNYD